MDKHIAFELSQHQIEFLTKIISDDYFLSVFVRDQENTEKRVFRMSGGEIERLCQYLTDTFVRCGIDGDDEPNQLGTEIESYIDLFYRKLAY